MTFKPLTVENGEGVLMSFLEAFLVPTSVVPGGEQASMGSKVPCGNTWQELSVKFDRDSSTWKTHQCLWEEDLPESSVTLPKWGMMRNGVLWERITSALPTSGIESGLLESWRSPAANEPGITVDRLETANGEPVGSNCRHYDKETGRMAQIGLSQQVVAKNQWPTPRAQEAKHGEPTDWEMQTDHAGTKDSLRVQVAKREQNWQTPVADDAVNRKEGKFNSRGEPKLSAQVKILTSTTRDWKQNWPTPKSSEYKGAALDRIPGTDAYRGNLCEKAELETGAPQRENGKVKRLNPDWTEWLMGWPIGWTSIKGITELDWRDWSVDPADGNEVPRVTSDNTNRVGRLKAIGNGQCPQAAALAFVILSQND